MLDMMQNYDKRILVDRENRVIADRQKRNGFNRYEDLVDGDSKFRKFMKQKSQDVQVEQQKELAEDVLENNKEQIYRILQNEMVKNRKANTNYGRKRNKNGKKERGALNVNQIVQTGFNLGGSDDSMC